MATLSEIREQVLELIIDTPPTVQARVDTLINRSIFKFEQGRFNFPQMERTFTTTTTALTRALNGPYPDDWKAARGRPFYRTNLGNTYFVTYYPNTLQAERAYGNDNAPDLNMGQPRGLVLSGPDGDNTLLGLDVYPLPDGNSDWSDGEYRLVIPYWGYSAPLVADGDTNYVTTMATDYVLYRATQRAFEMDWDFEKASYFGGKADQEYADAVTKGKLDTYRQMTTFVPHSGARSVLSEE